MALHKAIKIRPTSLRVNGRLKARRGGLVANKALARKLAAMFWRVMVHGTCYVERGLQYYEDQVGRTTAIGLPPYVETGPPATDQFQFSE